MDTASIAEWVKADFPFRAQLLVVALMLFASGPPLAMAIFLWRVGTRTIKENRYPPSGIRLLRDLPPVTGSPAQSRGRLIKVFATSVGATALLIALVLLRFAFLVSTPN